MQIEYMSTKDKLMEILIEGYQDQMNFWRAIGDEVRYRSAKEDLNSSMEMRFNLQRFGRY